MAVIYYMCLIIGWGKRDAEMWSNIPKVSQLAESPNFGTLVPHLFGENDLLRLCWL